MRKYIAFLITTLMFMQFIIFPAYATGNNVEQKMNAMESSCILKEFEDYISGGEGIAYHDTITGADSDIYSYTTDDVDIGPGGTGKVVAACDGEWIKYDINVPYTGDYTFELSYSKRDEVDNMRVEVYPQYGKAASVTLTGTGQGEEAWMNYQLSDKLNIPLKAGEQTIKLYFTGGAANLDYFKFTLNSELYLIVNKINRMTNYDEIYETVIENKDLFGDISAQTKNLFYPGLAMRHLINQGFGCFEEVKERLLSVLENEQSSKSVKITVNGTETTSYGNGTVKATIKAGLNEAVMLVYAIYDGNKLEKIGLKKSTKAANDTITFKDFVYDENKNYTTKILFWTKGKYSPCTNFQESVFDKSVYVNPEGNDSNSGSILEPVATIETAKNLVREYAEKKRNINVYVSGKMNIAEPLIFTSDDNPPLRKAISYIGDDTAEINAGLEVTKWSKYDENLYRAKLDIDDMRQFWVNGDKKQRARSVLIKQGEFRYWYDPDNVTGDVAYTSSSQGRKWVDPEADGFDVQNSFIPSELAGKKDVELVFDVEWARQRFPVDAISVGDEYTTFKLKQPYLYTCTTSSGRYIAPSYKDSFFIENAFEYLDEPGEFYFDKDTKYLYYYPEDGEELKNCYVGRSEGYIDLQGTSSAYIRNLTFKGFTFKYATWLQPNEQGIVTTQADCMHTKPFSSALDKNNVHLQSMFEAVYADNIEISNCKFYHTGSTAIGFRDAVSNITIKNNVFEDTAGAAIMLGSWMQHYSDQYSKVATDMIVQDNYVYDVANEYCGSVGIGAYYCKNTEFIHNTITKAAYTGISIGWGWGNTEEQGTTGNKVIGNKITDVMRTVWDGGHIYTLGYLGDSIISDNYCEGRLNAGGGGGIYLDSGTSYLTVKNNVIVCNKCINTSGKTVNGTWFLSWNGTQHNCTVRDNWYMNSGNVTAKMANSVFENNIDCSETGFDDEALKIIENAGVRN